MPILNNFNIENFREQNLNLCPYYCGFQDCEPGHYYGPAVRDHYLIHFIKRGKGFFQVGGNTYHLQQGQGFLICPGIVTYYQADMQFPWTYTWVAFHGLQAEALLKRANLSQENPVFSVADSEQLGGIMGQMVETRHIKTTKDTRLTGLLYLFISQLIEELGAPSANSESGMPVQEVYVKKVIEFVNMNYSRDFTIEDLAHVVGVTRKYLSQIFRKRMGVSPQHYLLQFRIHKACELMENPSLTLAEISWSVGYKDQLLFSKMFKKVKGKAPKYYRKALAEK